MFGRQTKPAEKHLSVSYPMVVLLIGAFSAPAFATNIDNLPCETSTKKVSLDVKLDELIAVETSHEISVVTITKEDTLKKVSLTPSNRLLAPQAEAAIRDAFADSESTPQQSELDETTAQPTSSIHLPMADTDATPKTDEEEVTPVPESGMTTKLPGISDDDYQRYKKQMYRRDI